MASETYESFVARKLTRAVATGVVPPAGVGGGTLKPFQRDVTHWALRKGRAAVFANTGLGKTRIGLEWAAFVAAHTGKPTLILAPLAVGAQTAAEGEAIGIPVRQARGPMDIQPHDAVVITNYERIEKFNVKMFGAVVLDESSCIKHHDTKTLKQLLEAFKDTRFKLCCTATPAPNDWTELGTHAEFLGACTRAEMLSEFFVHDGGSTQDWRLKGHAKDAFWRWVASWAALVSHPRDLGYDEVGYDLPELRVREHVIKAGAPTDGFLFVMEAETLMERRRARRSSIEERVAACAETVKREPGEAWVVWCDLNDESQALTAAIPDAIEITGSMTIIEKERALTAFGKGEARILVTKPSIAGFGLNWQHCARQAFVGVTDSWESYYQAVRRCWRFGQKRPVEVHVFSSEAEGGVVANLKRKDADAQAMAKALAAETSEAVRAEVRGLERTTNDYSPSRAMEVPSWAS